MCEQIRVIREKTGFGLGISGHPELRRCVRVACVMVHNVATPTAFLENLERLPTQVQSSVKLEMYAVLWSMTLIF